MTYEAIAIIGAAVAAFYYYSTKPACKQQVDSLCSPKQGAASNEAVTSTGAVPGAVPEPELLLAKTQRMDVVEPPPHAAGAPEQKAVPAGFAPEAAAAGAVQAGALENGENAAAVAAPDGGPQLATAVGSASTNPEIPTPAEDVPAESGKKKKKKSKRKKSKKKKSGSKRNKKEGEGEGGEKKKKKKKKKSKKSDEAPPEDA